MTKKAELLELIKRKAFFRKKIILSSGKTSNYYIDARLITLDPKGIYLITQLIFSFIKKNKITCIGGPTLGADPIVGALLLYSQMKKYSLKGFIVRKEEKKHGMRKLIEGSFPNRRGRILVIDDVITTGSSVLKVIDILEREKIHIFGCFCIVDRQEGARENLERKGIKLFSLFTSKDF